MKHLPGVMALTLIVATTGCDSPTQPTSPGTSRGPQTVLFRPMCVPEGANVRCTVSYFSNGSARDVTPMAAWQVSAAPLSLEATSVAAASAPGLIVPNQPGNITVFAEYEGQRTVANHSFIVAPGTSAVAVAPYLTGFGYVLDTGAAAVSPDIRVEIVDGPDRGKSDVTRANGFYVIPYVRMNAPFAVRASKPGYAAVVLTHPGIVDNSDGFPSNGFLHFQLEPSR